MNYAIRDGQILGPWLWVVAVMKASDDTKMLCPGLVIENDVTAVSCAEYPVFVEHTGPAMMMRMGEAICCTIWQFNVSVEPAGFHEDSIMVP